MIESKRFNVVIISPRGYQFSETFREIGETLLFGLRKLGHVATLRLNDFDPDSVNIVLGGHLLDEPASRELPDNTIIYNFEQVQGSSQWIRPPYVELVARHQTWDYSERNIATWRRYCPSARVAHVPLGFVPELSRVSKVHDEDIDVLFYGVINDRRARILDELKRAGLNVVAVTGTFGAERDSLIARAKVILNIHFFETKIFELARISYLLANRKAVVSELDVDTEVDDDMRLAVAGAPYHGLVGKCVELIFDDILRGRVADAGYAIFSRRAEEDILEPVLRREVAPDLAGNVALPTRINVGSGKDWNLEWLNLDVDPLWKPDLLADLNQSLPSPDPVDLGRFGKQAIPHGYFDEIRASHVLEHIPNLVVAMESFLRLLRVDGVLTIEVPYDLSYGAWQDPTHIRAMNERSWLYYTEWFWYLGWTEYRFALDEMQFVLSDYGQRLLASGTDSEELPRVPRAVDAMRVKLRKIPLSDAERARSARRWGA